MLGGLEEEFPFGYFWICLDYTVYTCAVKYTYEYKYIMLVFWGVYLLVILHIVVGTCRRHGQKYSEYGFFSGKLTTGSISLQVRYDPQTTLKHPSSRHFNQWQCHVCITPLSKSAKVKVNEDPLSKMQWSNPGCHCNWAG